MSAVTVVHLARFANGIGALQTFVDSYLRCEAGTAHDLVVICKGFDQTDDVEAELARVGRPWRLFPISDAGFDIGAYAACAKTITTELCCFLNSHCDIRTGDWLAKLVGAASAPGVGIAGATGSWESTFTSVAIDIRRYWRHALRRRELPATLTRLASAARLFPWWPNPHVRTNAFVVRTALFQQLAVGRDDRQSALRFESGRGGLMQGLSRRGLRGVVVGADGALFEEDAWPDSGTFRSRDQENLLVHDNQTRRYQSATPEERRRLGLLAWRDRFRAGA